MLYRFQICILIIMLQTGLSHVRVIAQQTVKAANQVAFFDSLDQRISFLQSQVNKLKQTRDVKYLNYQRELDHSLFEKELNIHILEEDLDKAKDLLAGKIKKSEFLKDQASVKFYYAYQEHVYGLIKEQRMHYQMLFKKGNIRLFPFRFSSQDLT